MSKKLIATFPANRKQFEVVPDVIAYCDWIAQEYPVLEGFEKLLPKEEKGEEKGEEK